MMDEKFYEELYKRTLEISGEKKGDAHDYSHLLRVLNNSLLLSIGEDCDIDIVKTSAILHDISRGFEEEGKVECHAEDGSRIAKKVLVDLNYPINKIGPVCYAIEVHRYSKGIIPRTIEARILQDADRLDVLGAIGIVRVFKKGFKNNIPFYNPNLLPKENYDGKSETIINHFFEKILKIKPETFHTSKAREIAEERYSLIKNFVESFIAEWECRK